MPPPPPPQHPKWPHLDPPPPHQHPELPHLDPPQPTLPEPPPVSWGGSWRPEPRGRPPREVS